MKYSSIFFLLLGVIGANCSGKQNTGEMLSQSTPQDVGLSATRLQYVDSLFNDYVDEKKLSGAVALIIRNGMVVKHKAYGYKNIDKGVAIKTDDLFRIASMTKAITAVGALILFERGKFGMDDPLWWYIPEFKYPKILDKVNLADSTYTSHLALEEIKIRHLFNHTSGLGYGFQDDKLNAIYVKHQITEGFEERDITLGDNVKRIANLPLVHEPGEKWTYGLSYDVLGYLIEVISGQPLDEYLERNIFQPLGMNDTHFYLPEEKFSRLPEVYMSSHDGVKLTDYSMTQYPIKGAKKYLSGGGDITCTAIDYAKFAQMVMNKGSYNGVQILGSRTVDWITNGQILGSINAIGKGFGVVQTNEQVLAYPNPGSCEWGGFFSTHCLVDPKEELIVILMLQMYPNWEWGAANRLQNIVYSSIETL